MKKFIILLAFFSMQIAQSQLIVNNASFTPAQLVQNVLLGNGITVSNIQFNGSAAAANIIQDKVGKFSNGNTTNIGLTSGIILATGKATVAIGPNDDTNASQPTTVSAGDPDLDLLTTNTINNKTIIEFDFIPNGNNLQFNFVFASEEYPEFANSNFNDVFGFFLSGPGITGPYSNNSKNIAIIPGSTPPTAITINNLNNGTANNGPCEYCANYVNNGTGTTPAVNTSIQYDGFTTVIAAVSDVECGQVYHIKLAIANVGDNGWDSAVFLEAGSFNSSPPFAFDNDFLISNGLAPCYSTSASVSTGLSNTIPHTWTLNGVVIPGETGPNIQVNQPGILCATVYPYGPSCPFTDCMTIEFLAPMPLGNPIDLNSCIGGTFDFTSNSTLILNGLSANDYDISYYNSLDDAQNSASPIGNITNYSGVDGETVWVGILDNITGSPCIETRSFTLHYVNTVTPTITCGTPTGSTVTFNWPALSGTANNSVFYQINSGSLNSVGLIGNINNYQVSGLSPGDNVQITVTPIGGPGTCFAPTTYNCTAAACPTINNPSSTQNLCFFGDPTPFSVNTAFTGSNAISYVYFNSQQLGDAMYTGGIPLGFSTPNAGGVATLDIPALGITGSLPNVPGTYYVYAIANPAPADATCRPYSEIQVTVNSIPSLPSVTTPLTYCQGESALPLSATGTSLLWYTNSTGGTGSSTAIVPSTVASGNTTYYVSQTVSGCEGPRAPIVVTVNATPALPTVTTPVTYCQNDAPSALVATGTGLLWYTASTGGTGSAVVPTPITSTSGVTNYYVSQTILNCEGPRAAILVTVNATPALPSVTTPVTYCQGATASALSATGTGLLWYNASTGGTGSATPPTPSTATTGTTTYYVSQTISNCEGPRASISVTILTAPTISTPSDYEACDDNSDGSVCAFNLQTKDTEITAVPGLTITYHLTLTDAQTGNNPIPNGTYCNISNPQTIYPRVYNPAAPACVSTTSFELIVNPKPQVNLSVSDYQLCDNNNSPDGIEEFDLSTKDAEIINSQPSMVVTYYFDQANATAQTNALPNLYTNVVANVQTIWFNIKNTVTGCTSVGSFKLVVNPLPQITVNSPTVCQGNSATIAATAATAANYTYVWTVPSGATDPGNVASFTTTTPGVYSVVATNTLTGCVGASASGTAFFITAPTYSVPTLYELCDDNNDGVSCGFLLNTKDIEVSTQPGVDISYHLTLTDAQTGANPLPKNTPYCNITNPQTIYPRIFNPAAPTCASTTSFQLMVNPKPAATIPSTYHICDDNTDGIQVFDLSGVITPQVLGTTLPAANYTVTYYTSLANAQAGTPIINPASAFVTTSTTIWIRVQNNATGCYTILTMSLVVDSLPQLPSPNFFPQYELCETVAPVCVETFDLTTRVPTILQGQLGMQVLFYPSLAEAISNTNVIANPSAYDNATPCVQTLGIRITNSITGCYVISTMDLVVNPKPKPIPPTGPYTVCGTDQSGLSCIDLTTNLTPNILFQSPGVYTISYHLTAADATNNLNAVNASWYCTINAFSQFLWVRAENPITHCFEIMQIELNVDPAPIMPPNLTAIANCDADSNTQDGCTTFNLDIQTPIILAAQVTPAANYTVSYYTTQASASTTPAGLSIFNTTSYTACGTTTIWVRVENNITHCFSVGSFQLQVNTPIVLTTPTLYSLCDYAQPTSPANDQYAIFDMLGFVGPVPGHTLEFYLDANHTQLISNPSAYQNNTNAAQTVFIIATNTATGCKSYRTLTIQVLPIPTPRTDLTSLPLVKCDDVNPNDGYEIFDLTVNANYIMNGDVNVTLHYFPSQQDAINNTAEILTPTTANVHQNVWIRVESMYNIDTQSPPQHCYVLVEQPIKVNPLPLIVPGVVYQECDDNTDGFTLFNLNSQASILLNGNALPLSDYTLAFYLDALLTQPIPSTFINTIINTQTIYVVATNTVTGCKSPVSQFTIVVNPKPILNIPPDFATCDDANANDGYYLYPLDVLIPGILGATQILADYEVNFYDTQYNPLATPPLLPTAITNLPNYQAYTHTLWVVVKNRVTGCERIATFNLVVEQKPQPKIEAITNVICVDYNTQQVVRDLLLTATNTTSYLGVVPTYTYQWYDAAGVAIPGATGSTYTVDSPFADNISTNYTVSMTSTSPQACSDMSSPFTVLQSGQAVTFPAGSQGYTITNAFSANQIITVNVTGYGNYQYSLDDGPRQDSNVFENVGLGEHYITVWDATAGIAYSCDPLVISNINTIDYPHYFTPNGDGIHDYWNIHGLENDFTAKIYIFDRYGKLIKQISPQGQGWDGTYNGILMPSTDYWFTVDYTEAAAYKQFKAHFSLKR